MLEHKRKTIATEDFIATERIDVQRDETPRIPKIKSFLLNNPVPNHLEVASVRYPCPRTGQRVKRSIDGHGRKGAWHQLESEGKMEMPESVWETVFEAGSYDEAVLIYYAFDSQDAVETSGDKFTGVCSKLGLDFNTPKLKKGALGKALQYAAKKTKALHGDAKLNNINRVAVVQQFAEALKALDEMSIGSKNKRFAHQAMWSACLMIILKYGLTDRVKLGLERLSSGNFGPGVMNPQAVTADAMSHIIIEWGQNPDEGELANCRGLTDAKSLPLQLDYLLFHWNKWMEDASRHYERSQWKAQKRHKKSQYRNNYYYNNFWDGTVFYYNPKQKK